MAGIRWYAEVHEGDNSLEVYQWLPTPTELVRYRYRQKGKSGLPASLPVRPRNGGE